MVRIASLTDLRSWIRRDLARYDRVPLRTLILEPQTRWLVRLRCTEYIANRFGGAAGGLARCRLQAGALKLGYTIPINRFGPGLKLPHWGTIVVNGGAQIGADCTLHPNTVIATRGGAPRLGDGVTVSPGVVIEGPITIGDGAFLAPNAVIRNDVASGDVVGGVPARSLHPERAPAAGAPTV